MFTERVSPNVIAVVDHNNGEIGHITKSVGCFYARRLGERRATYYATEEGAAGHFGFNVEPMDQVVDHVRPTLAVVAAVAVFAAFVACVNAQVATFAARAVSRFLSF